ncbi:hypothetical protein C8F04DRAFT_1351747 [Mycena alexandri]|uniref:Uncharacterized protein n=1 Tax=Mycena alexandri TaxID=1745969 RepID=A0AAD6SUL0_9AGAR|nr:hypothetical protein C8F04DRAFT_1351747 [Mycena alexandri]
MDSKTLNPSAFTFLGFSAGKVWPTPEPNTAFRFGVRASSRLNRTLNRKKLCAEFMPLYPKAPEATLDATDATTSFFPENTNFAQVRIRSNAEPNLNLRSGSGFRGWLNRTWRSSSAFREMCHELEPNRTLPALIWIPVVEIYPKQEVVQSEAMTWSWYQEYCGSSTIIFSLDCQVRCSGQDYSQAPQDLRSAKKKLKRRQRPEDRDQPVAYFLGNGGTATALTVTVTRRKIGNATDIPLP